MMMMMMMMMMVQFSPLNFEN